MDAASWRWRRYRWRRWCCWHAHPAASTVRFQKLGATPSIRQAHGPANTPERLTAHSLGAGPLLAGGTADPRRFTLVGHRRRVIWNGANPRAAQRQRRRPSRPRLRRSDTERSRLGRPRSRRAHHAGLAARSGAVAGAAARRTALALGRRARGPGDVGDGRRRVRPALRAGLDLVRARQRRPGAAMRRLGGRPRARSARGCGDRIRPPPPPCAAPGRTGDGGARPHGRRRSRVGGLAAAEVRPCRGRRVQSARPRPDRRGGVDRPDRSPAQPAGGRAAVGPLLDRAGGRPPGHGASGAGAGRRPGAGERGDLAPARAASS